MINLGKSILFTSLCGACISSYAATVYVSDQLEVGLYTDKTVTSPIIKTVPVGTPLELIKTEETLSFVRTLDGVGGWIDNSYLSQTGTGVTQLRDAQARIKILEESLAKAQQTISAVEAGTVAGVDAEKFSLEQELKSERVKVGDLQAQLAELRKRLGQDSSNDSLYEKIDQLAVENKQLQIQLARLLEGADLAEFGVQPAAAATGNSLLSLRNVLITLALTLIAGTGLGLYLMDLLNRRRHGGFRI
jgi:SH3 domain protein